jgi:hypothetical protein
MLNVTIFEIKGIVSSTVYRTVSETLLHVDKVYFIAGALGLYSSFRENNSTGNFLPVVCFVAAICNRMLQF